MAVQIQRSKDQNLNLLRTHLQTALELEHATIPPYLYCYWTIVDRSSKVAELIFSIVKEEMLHMIIAANILNAIGGNSRIRGKKFVPKYPTALPGHDQTLDPFKVHLRRCSKEAIVSFMHLELPKKFHEDLPKHEGWETIGEFYLSVIDLLKNLDNDVFKFGKQAHQNDAPILSGKLFSISSKEDALSAIHEIIEQGEGLGSTGRERDGEEAHFTSLCDIYELMGGNGEIIPGQFNESHLLSALNENIYLDFQKGILPVVDDPSVNNPLRREVMVANQKFNSDYSKVLDELHYQMRKPTPHLQYSIHSMFALTRNARAIMSIPVDPDDPSKGFCGPTFNYLYPAERKLKYDVGVEE